MPPSGGDPALHGVGLEDQHNLWMDLGERVGHTLVLGTTRVGKSRFAELLITQDIRRGEIVIVLRQIDRKPASPAGKADQRQKRRTAGPDYQDHREKCPILDWRKAVREGGIVYVGLDAQTEAEVVSAVGSAMFSDLTSVSGELYKHGDT